MRPPRILTDLRSSGSKTGSRLVPRSATSLGLVLLFGCSGAQIPQDFEGIVPFPKPVHKLRVAVMPFQDGRKKEETPELEDRFVYRGIEYDATNLENLRGDAHYRVTEAVARYLAKTRVFAQLILVLSKEQAPEADLILTGAYTRLRGYVEANAPDKKSGRPEDERWVLSEVLLSDLQLRELKGEQRVLMDADVGWSVHEKRELQGEVEPDPWAVLSETLGQALSELVALVARSDLSGELVVREEVHLDGTAGSTTTFGGGAPYGWRFVETSTDSAPPGWRMAAACKEGAFIQRQTLHFHRVLGLYQPAVTLWACPKIAAKYDGREEFPALYLGVKDRLRYFFSSLGESNWPDAKEEITAFLKLERPSSKYIFSLP